MDVWEVVARESIRDLVTRYNSNGDTGRFAQVRELFAEDAVMDVGGPQNPQVYRGIDEIMTIFTGAKERWGEEARQRGSQQYVRHCVSTHQIDVIDADHATGRCYFQVYMAHGLDHWGRYVDSYERRDGRWVFTSRKESMDGRVTLPDEATAP